MTRFHLINFMLLCNVASGRSCTLSLCDSVSVSMAEVPTAFGWVWHRSQCIPSRYPTPLIDPVNYWLWLFDLLTWPYRLTGVHANTRRTLVDTGFHVECTFTRPDPISALTLTPAPCATIKKISAGGTSQYRPHLEDPRLQFERQALRSRH